MNATSQPTLPTARSPCAEWSIRRWSCLLPDSEGNTGGAITSPASKGHLARSTGCRDRDTPTAALALRADCAASGLRGADVVIVSALSGAQKSATPLGNARRAAESAAADGGLVSDNERFSMRERSTPSRESVFG
jgi:hypothetical protein